MTITVGRARVDGMERRVAVVLPPYTVTFLSSGALYFQSMSFTMIQCWSVVIYLVIHIEIVSSFFQMDYFVTSSSVYFEGV